MKMEKLEFKGNNEVWKYRSSISKNCYYIETSDKNHRKTFIGEVGGGLQQSKMVEANAKLISATPELLEVVMMFNKYTLDELRNDFVLFLNIKNKAEKVLKKALCNG